jgi:hypothetical protein
MLGPYAKEQVDLADLERAKVEAAALTAAADKAAAWREIAWRYYDRGDLVECRKARRTALASIEPIQEPFLRSLHYVLLADLDLELGDRFDARQRVRRAIAAEAGPAGLGSPPLFQGLAQSSTAPVIIGVMVRAGFAQDAMRAVGSSVENCPQAAWWALGAFCALDGKAGELEPLLESVPDEKTKATLSMGVVHGLYERLREGHAASSR